MTTHHAAFKADLVWDSPPRWRVLAPRIAKDRQDHPVILNPVWYFAFRSVCIILHSASASSSEKALLPRINNCALIRAPFGPQHTNIVSLLHLIAPAYPLLNTPSFTSCIRISSDLPVNRLLLDLLFHSNGNPSKTVCISFIFSIILAWCLHSAISHLCMNPWTGFAMSHEAPSWVTRHQTLEANSYLRGYGYSSCPSGTYNGGDGYCYRNRSGWYNWGRWVVLAIIIIAAFFIFFAFASVSRYNPAQPSFAGC